MKNLLPLVIASGVSLGIGFFAGRITSNYSVSISPMNQPTIPFVNDHLPSVFNPSASSGTSKYEIYWDGTRGQKFTGIYVVMSMTGEPARLEKVEATLPHKITLSLRNGTVISADSNDLGQNAIKVKIYKDGKDCGKKAFVGSAAEYLSGLACQ